MPDQPASQGSNNPRNNPRQHKKPTRRSAASAASSPASAPRAAAPSQQPAGAQPSGRDAASREAEARAAYEGYVSATNRPYPGSAAASHDAPAMAPQQAYPQGRQAPPQPQPQSQPQRGYAGYAAQVPPRVMPATPSDGKMAPYADMGRYKKRGKKKASVISVIAALVILAAIGAGVYLYLNPLQFNVTVNGMTRTVDRGTTLGDIIAEGVVSPTPGNLVAVDGEVLEEGGGTAFTGTLNGDEVTDQATELHKGDSVQMDNGVDVTEDYDAETVETEPGQVELGEGAIHVYVPGETAQIEKRTGKVSGKTVEETVREGSDNIYLRYNANTNGEKVIALTFDDGPWPTTHELLDVLKENGAVATFFTIGEQISDKTDYMQTIQRMAAEGHQIGTHSYDHAATGGGNGVDMTRQSPEKQIEEVQMGQQAIAEATGKEASKAFRSPGGNFHDEIIWNLQPYITSEIGWNVDTEDWRTPGADAIAQRILSAKSGDIVLMHDGGGDRSQTIEALEIALPKLKAEGFKFVTIDQLLAYDDAKALAQDLAAQQASE
ncbi:polysaccharide deacetylase family protein [Adlercreutzia sp. R25]|uniref:polysaccharide deacetylase family protein n=1 Tax=Adlercreutzia shanghongiae TaxID=3111773 RepID=UPI002DBF4789|nr:polysaccharide deacetylase family protein [Adlercreutzia sp. R25]MEC4273442.1 polysaccharide deacetylase family protein [Adlercreutzia sp. R25]